MPLRALIDNRDIVAPLLSDDEWEKLKLAVKQKKSQVILPCCQNNGFLRVSKLGTKHFVHRTKQNCNWKSESMEHIKAKSEIVLACKDSGYEALSEVSGEDWRADVLAIKNDIKIAFEVQLSAQTLEETIKVTVHGKLSH